MRNMSKINLGAVPGSYIEVPISGRKRKKVNNFVVSASK